MLRIGKRKEKYFERERENGSMWRLEDRKQKEECWECDEDLIL